jgi:SAM-dependent methyltransferase
MQSDEKLTLLARLLMCFCRKPGTTDYPMHGVHFEQGKELEELEQVFPRFREGLADKTVLDFGCGFGYQSVAFCQAGARQVIGIDINQQALDAAAHRASSMGLNDPITFVDRLPEGLKCDVIVSQNSFEHFIDAETVLASMQSALDPKGKIFITFAPPWYAPWGGHMGFFCRLPWVQILFPEQTVIEARSRFRSDNATSYRDLHLAKMSVQKFSRIVKRSGLHCSSLRLDCSLGMNWLRFTPLREFFVNRVSCVLTSGR